MSETENSKISGRFEYDIGDQALYFMPDDPKRYGTSPFIFHLDPKNRSRAEGKTVTPDKCILWFDEVEKGKNRLSIISCDISEI